MILYMLRHGETDWNKEHKLQGSVDIPLNEKGRHVARLTKVGLENVKFDVAFTSPLLRARETAEIILSGSNVEIIIDDRIREVGFGAYEGTDAKNKAPELALFFEQPEAFASVNGIESYEHILERVGSFWQDLCENETYKDSTILLTTHGAAMKCLISVMKEKEIADIWKSRLHKNCGITIVEVKDGKVDFLEEAIILYDESEL